MSNHENPGHGNVSEVWGFRVNQTSRTTEIAAVSARLNALTSSQGAQAWQSSAGTAWHERIARVYPSLDAASYLAGKWGDATDSYKRLLESTSSQADAANHKIDHARTMLYSYSHVPGEVSGTPQFQAKLRDLEDDIDEGHRTIWTLRTQRDHIDATCANALNMRSGLGEHRNWTALQDIYGGAKTVDDIRDTRNELVDKYTELGDKVANSSASLEEIDELARFLANSSADPALAEKFWDHYTGDEVTVMLGNGVSDRVTGTGGDFNDELAAGAAIDFAQGLRASFAAASERWTQSEAEEFAAQMWAGPGDPPPGNVTTALGEIGYLFDDAAGSPMSEHFTVAMANLIDTYERGVDEYGNLHGPAFSGLTTTGLVSTGFATTMDMLWFAEHAGDPTVTHTSIHDPMSRVLDTLAVYPDAAWDWLTNSDTTLPDGTPGTAGADNRLEYYSRRDWSADSWDGISTLWGNSMFAEGGLMAGPANTVMWNEQCDVAARMVDGLAEGMDGFRPGDMTSEGATSLATTLGRLMPLAGPSLWAQGAYDQHTYLIDTERNVPGMDSLMNVPYLDLGAFGDLVGQAGSVESGFSVLRSAVSRLEDQILADVPENPEFKDWNLALERIYTLEANFDGAVGGAEIVQGRFDDDVIRSQIAIMDTLWSLAPIPMPAGVVGDAVGLARGQAEGGLSSWYESQVLTNESWAVTLVDGEKYLGVALIELQLDPLLDRLVDGPNPVDTPEGQTPQEWRDTLASFYKASFEQRLWTGAGPEGQE